MHALRLRPELDAVDALDALVGPFLVRVFAGLGTGPQWRRRTFDRWWETVSATAEEQR